MRWLGAILALAAASAIVSDWRLAPAAGHTVVRKVATIVPSIFTAVSAQAPMKVCTKKPVTGETMIYTLSSASATTTGSVTHTISSTPSNLNFAGLSGPAGVFASSVPLPAGDYAALNLVMSDVMLVQGVVTCDVDGGGPLPTRTYYTGGNPDMTAADPFALNPADATPVQTTITSGGGPMSASLSVPFTIAAGADTSLNVMYDTDEGFALWDISVITGVPESYKIVPNDMSIMAAFPAGP